MSDDREQSNNNMDNRNLNRRTVLKGIGAGAVGGIGMASTATANSAGIGKYRDVSRAVEDGYVRDPDGCIPEMGLHYINFDLIDDDVKVSQPEALVYAHDGDELRYLGVEYLATEEFRLFGHDAHFIGEIKLWGLHAWFFEKNDLGKHAVFHSNVDENCNFVTD